jgi:hypothetical protein
MTDLTGRNEPVELAPGVSLTAPGVFGSAELEQLPTAAHVRGAVPHAVASTFAQALKNAGLRESYAVLVTPEPLAEGAGDEGAVVFQVPRPEGNTAAVLMVSDAAGIVTWHFAQAAPATADLSAKASGGSLLFLIPRERLTAPSAPPEAALASRLIGGWIGKKLLSLIVYPIAEHAIGWVAEEIAAAWEKNARPYGVRRFTLPEARVPAAGALSDAGWRLLAEGRALLFVHGIFSTCASAFAGLSDDTLVALSNAYGDRVFAFDHPTVSVDPVANVREFLSRIPPGVKLDVDIVCHSRGGLVARILSGELGYVPVDQLAVGRIVFAGTPNAGTPLVDASNISALIDRFTSLLNVVPPGPWSTIEGMVEGILELVKIVGVGAMGGLPGLNAMAPGSDLLTALDAGPAPGAVHYAVHANFEPTGALISLLRAGDAVMDTVFGEVANDVAVPSLGVGTVPGDLGFPVSEQNTLSFGPGPVWHCSYFSQKETATSLIKWLTS